MKNQTKEIKVGNVISYAYTERGVSETRKLLIDSIVEEDNRDVYCGVLLGTEWKGARAFAYSDGNIEVVK